MFDIVLGRTPSDLKKFGKKGTVFIGKQYVQMGQTSSLSNPIYMDVARAHAMLICGKRGGGKCLDGDSEIITENGKLVKIKDFFENQEKILSLNTDYKINKYKYSDFYKRKSKELINLKLRSGKELNLTPEHPLLTVNKWLPIKELKVGTRIATPRFLPVEGNKKIGINKAKILGYLIAEGHLSNGFVLFSNKDQEIVKDFSDSILSFNPKLIIKEHGKSSYRIVEKKPKLKKITERDDKGRIISYKNFCSKSCLRLWLDEINLYGHKSDSKTIPECIFTSPNYEIREFLKTLFSCDGSIYRENENYWKISYCSISKGLIKQVSHLLLRFGIISKFREKKIKYNDEIKTAYEIEIKGIFVKDFIEKIGFIGEKYEKAKIALKSIKNIIRNSNLDTIPKEIWDRYSPSSWTEIGKKLDYKHPKSLRESKRYAPTRNKLSKIAEYDNNNEIYNLANSDIFWDEIVSIDKMIGNFTVYDISCPDFNNFVANDIVVHNSYTLGSIAEGLADLDPDTAKNLSFVLMDTMGVYWPMKYPNRKDDDLLKKWGLESKGLNVIIYVPGGFYNKYKEDGIPVDFPFYIKPNELSVEDWMHAFKLEVDDPVGVGVQMSIGKLLEKGINFSIDDIINEIQSNERLDDKIKLAVENRFENAKTWGIFSKNGTAIRDILVGGSITVMDFSSYVAMPGGWEVKALVLGIISKKIFVERMLVRKNEELFDIINKTQVIKQQEVKDDLPMPWLIVDEAHEFLPAEGMAPSSQALITILREGRQPGVSLIMATQQPAKIHTDAITQSDIVMSHRLTASFDLEALDKVFLSYDSKGSKSLFNSMPRVKGCAIIMDDKNERLHTMQVKPRITWHGGEDPNAIREVKDEFDLD